MYLDGLDELDQKIIRLLIENARISYSDIGEETGISRVAVKARIQASDFYSRNPLISLMRDKIILQLQLIMPGSVSMTLCRKYSISSPDEATACI